MTMGSIPGPYLRHFAQRAQSLLDNKTLSEGEAALRQLRRDVSKFQMPEWATENSPEPRLGRMIPDDGWLLPITPSERNRFIEESNRQFLESVVDAFRVSQVSNVGFVGRIDATA